MKSRGWKHCPPSFGSSNDTGGGKEASNTIHNEVLDSIEEGGKKSISFFNEIDIGIRTMLLNLGSIPGLLFHFFNELDIEMRTMLIIGFNF
jgi:hypothetical protein